MNFRMPSLRRCGRSGGETVHALDSRSRGQGSRPGLVIVLSLSETAYYYSSHLHPGTQMFTIELSGWLDEIL